MIYYDHDREHHADAGDDYDGIFQWLFKKWNISFQKQKWLNPCEPQAYRFSCIPVMDFLSSRWWIFSIRPKQLFFLPDFNCILTGRRSRDSDDEIWGIKKNARIRKRILWAVIWWKIPCLSLSGNQMISLPVLKLTLVATRGSFPKVRVFS